MNLFRRPKPPPLHPAIQLRISSPSGTVIETDSDELHHLGVISGEPGWFQLIGGGADGTMEFSTVPLKIEVKPIALIEDPE